MLIRYKFLHSYWKENFLTILTKLWRWTIGARKGNSSPHVNRIYLVRTVYWLFFVHIQKNISKEISIYTGRDARYILWNYARCLIHMFIKYILKILMIKQILEGRTEHELPLRCESAIIHSYFGGLRKVKCK